MPPFPFFTSKYSIWVLSRFWTTLRTGYNFPHIHFTCITRVNGSLYIVPQQLPGHLRGHTKVISWHLSQVEQDFTRAKEVWRVYCDWGLRETERLKSSLSERDWNQEELPWLRGFQKIPRSQKMILLSWLIAAE